MTSQLLDIANFIIAAFLHVWPYLLVTIPLAVAVHMTGGSQYITRAFRARPIAAIFIAALVGAISPFCSCGVIPVIAALLIGGVPLAPVMTFWIASPSMDPEIFFLSVGMIGWELAVWRLAATLALSLSAGFVTHFLMHKGWLGTEILRTPNTGTASFSGGLRRAWNKFKPGRLPAPSTVSPACCAASSGLSGGNAIPLPTVARANSSSIAAVYDGPRNAAPSVLPTPKIVTGNEAATPCPGCEKPLSFRKRLLRETYRATMMVVKFMALAFFLEALIMLYVPDEWIVAALGRQNPWAILTAALVGVPAYTSNLTALPMLAPLLAKGMDPGAALAFLIAGPVTTLPAMAAVWGLVSRRVFALYLSFALVGAIVFGYLFSIIHRLI